MQRGYGRGYSRGRGTGGPPTTYGSFPRRSQNVNVFFTGVPLSVDKNKVRQHFESVGRVVDFKIFDPKPGIDYRHGLVEYMDERTAADAISRLNGTTFGDRAMRVAEAKERGRDFKFASRGRGSGGAGGLYAERRREGMTFPRGFQDPVLGRGEGIVFNILKSMTTEDAYEAVEQLRVLALERRRDARALLLDNPALRSAVVMILQHAGRLPAEGSAGGGSSLPAEAFQGGSTSAYDALNNDEEAEEAEESKKRAADGGGEGGPASKRQATEVEKDSGKADAAKQQQDEVLEIISAMSEEDVDRILNMTSQDLAQVADPAQRLQLEVLRDRLIEMSSEL